MTTEGGDGQASVSPKPGHNPTMSKTNSEPTDESSKLNRSFKLSRDPSEYEASTHLLQRIRERKILERDIVAEVIEGGKVVKVDSNNGGSDRCITLRGDWLFSTFEVKVCPKDKVVQTAYEVES